MVGLLIVDEEGEIKRTTLPTGENDEESKKTWDYARSVAKLTTKARSVVRDLSPLVRI